jgi:DNA repair protein RadC
MADMNSTASNAHNRGASARETVPIYGVGAGVLSFRHGLQARERGVIDRALAIVGRCLREPGAVAIDPAAAMDYIRLHIGGESIEVFCAMYLDSQNRVIAFDRLFTGTLTQTSVYPREVIRAALAHGAASVILAHNHPSGNVLPSRADEVLTQTLNEALALVDVRVLDHIIVSGQQALSMAGRGFYPFHLVANAVATLPTHITAKRKRGRPSKVDVTSRAA